MNKGITLLLLGVIACAMGIVLFLQMGQRNTNEMVSNQEVLVSSIENATKTITPSVASKPVTETSPPLTERTVPTEDLIKKVIEEPVKKNVQQEIASQEKAPTEQKDITQEKAPIEQKAVPQEKPSLQQSATQPVATTTNSSTSSDAKNAVPQIKESSTKKLEAKSTDKKLTPAAKTDISSGTTRTHEMSSLAVQFSGSAVHVVIKADSTFAYKTMLLSSPDRLVIDLPGTWKKVATATTPKNRLLEKIRIGSQPSGPRIVLDLKGKPQKYSIYKVDNSTLEIVIE